MPKIKTVEKKTAKELASVAASLETFIDEMPTIRIMGKATIVIQNTGKDVKAVVYTKDIPLDKGCSVSLTGLSLVEAIEVLLQFLPSALKELDNTAFNNMFHDD